LLVLFRFTWNYKHLDLDKWYVVHK
jgi:hypothetical protein